MKPVRFAEGDAWLLWTIPHGGCDLEHLIRTYAFVARVAIPPFGDEKHSTSECGIMELDDYLGSGEWSQVGPDFAINEDEYRLVTERGERCYESVFNRRTE